MDIATFAGNYVLVKNKQPGAAAAPGGAYAGRPGRARRASLLDVSNALGDMAISNAATEAARSRRERLVDNALDLLMDDVSADAGEGLGLLGSGTADQSPMHRTFTLGPRSLGHQSSKASSAAFTTKVDGPAGDDDLDDEDEVSRLERAHLAMQMVVQRRAQARASTSTSTLAAGAPTPSSLRHAAAAATSPFNKVLQTAPAAGQHHSHCHQQHGRSGTAASPHGTPSPHFEGGAARAGGLSTRPSVLDTLSAANSASALVAAGGAYSEYSSPTSPHASGETLMLGSSLSSPAPGISSPASSPSRGPGQLRAGRRASQLGSPGSSAYPSPAARASNPTSPVHHGGGGGGDGDAVSSPGNVGFGGAGGGAAGAAGGRGRHNSVTMLGLQSALESAAGLMSADFGGGTAVHSATTFAGVGAAGRRQAEAGNVASMAESRAAGAGSLAWPVQGRQGSTVAW